MWFVIASIIIILFIVLIWWIQHPLYYRNVKSEGFEKYLKNFLSQCADGSLMFIEHAGSVRFVQFAIRNNSHIILHFGFPDAPWSREYFAPVMKQLQTLKIDYNVTTCEGPTRRFLEVYLSLDDQAKAASVGAQIARVAFEAMGLTESARFKIHYEGELSPEAVRSSLEPLGQQPNKLIRTLSRYYLKRLNAKKRSGNRNSRP